MLSADWAPVRATGVFQLTYLEVRRLLRRLCPSVNISLLTLLSHRICIAAFGDRSVLAF